MKTLVKIMFVIVLFIELGIFASTSATVSDAACPADDLYCQWWTPKDQIQKDRVAKVFQLEAQYPMPSCDQTCVDEYDAQGGGVLGKMATINNLPKNALVNAYRGYWNFRAQGVTEFGKVADVAEWLNDFTDQLRVNHPYKILDKNNFRLAWEYGGEW